jgi:DNA recombination protein RmuC
MTETLIQIGDFHFTLTHALLSLIVLAIALFVALMVMMGRNKRLAYETDDKLETLTELQAQMTGRMQTIAEVFGSRQSDVMKVLTERLDGVGVRVGESIEKQNKSTSETLGKLQERLAVIDKAQSSLGELAGEMLSLKDILANKQSRGAFGQGRMEALLTDGLPKNAYSFQFTLSNGKRPDAIIHLPGDARGLVVDAKFPLEGVHAWRQSQTSEEKIQSARRVKADLSKHINDIEERYFLPGETQDMALLFVPSEGIYAELHEYFDEILQKAFRARVIIVSPSLLMLAIQVMQSLMRDDKMREQVHHIRAEVGLLTDDIRRLSERILNLQKHFGQANDDISQIMVSQEKVMRRSQRLTSLEFDEKNTPAIAKLFRVVE